MYSGCFGRRRVVISLTNNGTWTRCHGSLSSSVLKQEDGEVGVFGKSFSVEDETSIKTALPKPKRPMFVVLKNGGKSVVEHLLPKDYETSIGPNYLGYVGWGMAAGVVGTMSGVLSMQSLLFAVGLGQGSIPTAAALNWILKDGLGQLGGVLFASMINQRFDAEPRRWRFKSAVILDASILIEVLTPWFPNYFLPLATFANIGKNVGWLSASATRAGIHRSFMRVENLADITGKAGSQTIASSVVGTGLGIGLSSLLGPSTMAIFCATMGLSVLHLSCTYKALHTVTIRTLNLQRLWLALRPSLVYNNCTERIDFNLDKLLTPSDVAPKETICHLGKLSARRFGNSILEQEEGKSRGKAFLRIGPPVSSVFETSSEFLECHEETMARGDKHIVSVTHDRTVNLLFYENAKPEDVMCGLVHAILVYQSLSVWDSGRHGDLVDTTRGFLPPSVVRQLLDQFSKQGWDIEYLFFEPFRARIKLSAA